MDEYLTDEMPERDDTPEEYEQTAAGGEEVDGFIDPRLLKPPLTMPPLRLDPRPGPWQRLDPRPGPWRQLDESVPGPRGL